MAKSSVHRPGLQFRIFDHQARSGQDVIDVRRLDRKIQPVRKILGIEDIFSIGRPVFSQWNLL